MSFLLNGTTIKAPSSIEELNSTQVAQQRTLSGRVGRDYFGSNKRVWLLKYANCKKTDYDTINTIYQSYLTTGTGKSFESTEANYDIDSTTVHIDLLRRDFSTKGTDYLSAFDLVLTEA